MLHTVRNKTPQLPKSCFVAPTAALIGDVVFGERCSVWYNVTIRGDVEPIKIGTETNIQDNTVIHGTHERCGVTLGDRVTIGHSVVLHGCTIDRGTLVGMGSIVMDKAHVGEHCLIGAGTLITENSVFAPGHLILGRPGKIIRKLTDEEISFLEKSADNYLDYMKWYV